jgi:2-polyprenyl-6-hydroxyphenyl methylase/3-demethylubiquinone-9 3-methyltransferase
MKASSWNHSTREEFLRYYADRHARPDALRTFVAARDLVLRFVNHSGPLDVADIGCGAGAQSLVWAAMGHRVHGLDVSADLVGVARRRALAAGHDVDFRVGSATELPWADDSMDVCLALELLEHVPNWTACLDEFARVLRDGGVLLLSTTNVLCPVQHEFALPLYAWYPRRLKRRYERLAVTTRPDLVRHAVYPAVHWFTFYRLRAALRTRGFRAHDRFDVMDLTRKGLLVRGLVTLARCVPLLRWLGYVATPYTLVLAIKDARPA